jgi:hypothetical protein
MTKTLSACTHRLGNGQPCPNQSDARYQNGFRGVHTQPVCSRHYNMLRRENTTPCKLKGCQAEAKSALGYCRRHEHVPLEQLTYEQRRNTWDTVLKHVEGDSTTGCWIYTGRTQEDGYVRFTLKYGLGNWLGHRLTYHLIWTGHHNSQQLDHLCNNTRCINPLHVHPLSAKENTRLRNRRANDPQAPWYYHAELIDAPLSLIMVAALYELPVRPWQEHENQDGTRTIRNVNRLPQSMLRAAEV